MKDPVRIYFGVLKILVLEKLQARDLNVANLSTYNFSTLYTILTLNLIKDKLIDLI